MSSLLSHLDPNNSIAALAAFITAAVSVWLAIRNGQKINTVQVTVNHRLDEALARVDQLTHALEHSDTAVPEKRPLPPPKP